MTKLEFMKELESLLSDIPLEEREEALRYYNGYFEDAGEDHEEEIIKELVSPERVASIIKADLNSNAADRESRGYFTENGYQDTIINNERYEIARPDKKKAGNQQAENSKDTNTAGSTNNTGSTNGTYHSYSNNNNSNQTSNRSNYNSNPNIILIIILAVFTSPFWIGGLGIIIGILATFFGLIIGFGAAGIAMMVAGIGLVIAGLVQLSVPLMGILFCGAGLLVLGLGMLFMLVCISICKHVVPAVVRGFVNLCRLPFKNRSVTA